MANVIEMKGITKTFPGIKANDNIHLQLKQGEVHALLGENGAGKSTLMGVLFGLYQADEGTIHVNGEPVTIRSPNDANALGIGMVHQHFKLVDRFTVLQNIILGQEDVKAGFLKYDAARERVLSISKQYGLNIDPDALIEDISVGQQQRVEILKVLYRQAEILILDEPTASLTPQEINELMQILERFKKEGKSILFISHKLEEIRRIADRCTILRKGKHIDTIDVKGTTNEELAEKMVGRKVVFNIEKPKPKIKDTVLSVENVNVQSPITKKMLVKDVSFEVKAGEILCIAGIEGNGQTELVYGLTGMYKVQSGTILLNGEDVTPLSIRQKALKGIAHIPEDRQKHGLVLDFPLDYNLVLQRYFAPPFQKRGFLQFDTIRAHAERLIERFDIRSGGGALTMVRNMSGGNQQKAILGREIDRGCALLIGVQPTRGLDVGAIEAVQKELIRYRDEGKAVLIISYDLNEVFTISDRIMVMFEGENVGILNPDETTQETLGLYMSGSKRMKQS